MKLNLLKSDVAEQLRKGREDWMNDRKGVVEDLANENPRPVWFDHTDTELRGEGDLGQKNMTFDREKKTGVFAITTPTVDSSGDVVVPEGGDLKRYRKNPVVLFGHNYGGMPIARSLREEIDPGVAIFSEAEFAVGLDEEKDFPLTVFNYFAAKFLNAVSIGFIPARWEKRMIGDDEGGQVWKGGFIFHEWTLLEFSAVSVPANEDALALAVKGVSQFAREFGLTDREEIVKLLTPRISAGKGFAQGSEAEIQALAKSIRESIFADLHAKYDIRPKEIEEAGVTGEEDDDDLGFELITDDILATLEGCKATIQ